MIHRLTDCAVLLLKQSTGIVWDIHSDTRNLVSQGEGRDGKAHIKAPRELYISNVLGKQCVICQVIEVVHNVLKIGMRFPSNIGRVDDLPTKLKNWLEGLLCHIKLLVLAVYVDIGFEGLNLQGHNQRALELGIALP